MTRRPNPTPDQTGPAGAAPGERLVLDAADPLDRARDALGTVVRLARHADTLDTPTPYAERHLATLQRTYADHAQVCALVALASDTHRLTDRIAGRIGEVGSCPPEPARGIGYGAAISAAEARYAAVQDHIRAVDAKASLAATIQAAALGLGLGGLPAAAPLPARLLSLAALGGLLVALGCAAGVIFPRLRSRQAARSRDGLYFGELRTWTPAALAAHLTTQTPAARLDGLCRQLVAVSAICWAKHRWLRRSLLAAAVAVACHAAAALATLA